jgi:hypothetical protein
MHDEEMHSAAHEEAMRADIQHAVEFGDDDALERVVEALRKLRFVEVRRVLDPLDNHQLRRVAETAISLPATEDSSARSEPRITGRPHRS